jgi:UDP-N-acetylmuramate dehydrogenase
MNLERLVDWVIGHRLSGLECFVGIPGTVGGAVAGNAGAWGVQLADRLVSVSGWTPEGDPFTFSVEDCGFEYRDSRLKREGHWISEITLQLTEGDPEELLREKTRILSERAARHPDWRLTPCIGSFFKNLAPTSSAGRRQAAGWFLEEAGAKDCRVGGAAVFERHANILIKASEDCRSRDVADLAQLLQTKVKEVHGIELQREVRFLGDVPGYESHPGFW